MINRLIKLFPFMLFGFDKQEVNKEKAKTEIFKRNPKGGYCEQEVRFRNIIENRNK